ncbi:camp-dependent protein kinase catalytic subunit [Dinochytrium kinnereticum]|nr:camp-dependent protein kinase catalytic subunit [Dinochytrium kinnereticum]
MKPIIAPSPLSLPPTTTPISDSKAAGRPQDSGIVTSPEVDPSQPRSASPLPPVRAKTPVSAAVLKEGSGGSGSTTPRRSRTGSANVNKLLKSSSNRGSNSGLLAGQDGVNAPGVPAAVLMETPGMMLQKELEVLQAITQKLKSPSSNSISKMAAEEKMKDSEDQCISVAPSDHAGGKPSPGIADTRVGAPLPPIQSAQSTQQPQPHQKQPQTNPMFASHMIKTQEIDGLPDFPTSLASTQNHPNPPSGIQTTWVASSHQLPTYASHQQQQAVDLPFYGTSHGEDKELESGGVISGGVIKKRSIRGGRKGSQPLISRGGGDSGHDKLKISHPPEPVKQTAPPDVKTHPQPPTAERPPSSAPRPSKAAPQTDQNFSRNYNLLDFDIREQIGKGAFARVHLVRFQPRGDSSRLPASQICRSGNTKITYAMKSLRKVDIVATKQVKHVMNEKTLLQSVRHPFIVNLLATFQDPKHLYLVMEYVPGGDMFTHLKKNRRFPEMVARFYTAEILLALEYIHAKDIVYRDLKPENILVGVDGHIKIADFGFAKRLKVDEKAMTFCGTPAYMAPEIILKYGYSKSVDWWSLGIVCYELQAGYSPFQADTALKIYENIVDGEMRWSSQIGNVSKDLLKRLLEMSPSRRLGSGRGGAKEIKDHPWFKGLDWKSFEAKEVMAPHLPVITGEGDVSNFDVYSDVSSVILMQNGTLEITDNDCIYDDVFKEF